MANSERILGCALVALLGGCTLLTNADDHRDGTGTDGGPSDAFVADSGGDDLGVGEDMGPLMDMSVPGEDMFTPDMGPGDCGVGDLNGGSLLASGLAVYDVTDFTLELWYQPTADALSGDRNLFGRWGALGSTGSYALYLRNGVPALALSCDGSDFFSFDGLDSLEADVWVHLAATFNASTRRVRVFVDGESVVSQTASCGPANSLGTIADLVLGYDDPSGGNPAPGLVDEVRLSSVVRYPDEFAPARTFSGSESSTVALYHFEDESLPASDSSPNANPMARAPAPNDAVGLTTACRP